MASSQATRRLPNGSTSRCPATLHASPRLAPATPPVLRVPSAWMTTPRRASYLSHAAAWALEKLGPADTRELAHVRHQRGRAGDRTVWLLIVLQDGDERAPHGEAGAVQRMHIFRPAAALAAKARVHAPSLEIAADGAGRDLAVGVLPRQPHLDVVGLLRGKAHV